MANESDRSSGSNTLPAPELNPLSNPLLAENLRRWAEVYFNNPPEQRDRAVLKLVHELEREKMQADVVNRTSANLARAREAFVGTSTEANQAGLVRCKSCGHDNPKSQKFCGMCGTTVPSDEPQTPVLVDRDAARNWDLQERPPYNQDEAEGWRSELDSTSINYDSTGFEESAANANELSLFQSVPPRDYDVPDWDYTSSTNQPYRIYIGIVLAAILAGLGYMAWRGTLTSSQSNEVSPAPPAVAKEVDRPSTQAAAAQAATARPADTAEGVPPAAAKNAADEASDTTPDTTSKSATKTVRKHSSDKPIPAAESGGIEPAASREGKGEEELSIAERYLSGTNGERRDNAQAAKWLWRSVAKHNDRASVLLADLYLRGHGVSKNCDQARVLLDSAARKGMPAAGVRLRNLQAFGCQ